MSKAESSKDRKEDTEKKNILSRRYSSPDEMKVGLDADQSYHRRNPSGDASISSSGAADAAEILRNKSQLAIATGDGIETVITLNNKMRQNVTKFSNHSRSYGHLYFWGDYFNNLLKCWEPLLEPFSFVYLYEKVTSTMFISNELLFWFTDKHSRSHPKEEQELHAEQQALFD